MHKFHLSLYIFLLAQTAHSATQPVHFDVGDIPPREKVKINMNLQHWPGYHDIKCDIVDPSYSSILKISTDDNSSAYDFIEINNVGYYLPLQISMSKEKNSLFISNYYNEADEKNNYFIFENLDDDVTISIKNCEISPHVTLNENYMYLPSEILCVNGNCKLQEEDSKYWSISMSTSDLNGKFRFSSIQHYSSGIFAEYRLNFGTGSVTLNNLQDIGHYRPVLNNITKWYESSNNYFCSGSVPDCPLFRMTDK